MNEKRDERDFWMSEEFPRGDFALPLDLEVLWVMPARGIEDEGDGVVRFRAVPLPSPGPMREQPIDATD